MLRRDAARLVRAVASSMLVTWSSFASASASSPALSQYGHTAWRIQDGAFSGTPTALAQTPDGYIWIGTMSGLIRFDGVRFVPYPAQMSVLSLLASKDGTLWIGTTVGLRSIDKNGRVQPREVSSSSVNAIVETSVGAIWYARSRNNKGEGPLCKVEVVGTKCFGKEDGVAAEHGLALTADRFDNLWMANQSSVTRWNAGESKVFVPEPLRTALAPSVMQALLPREDGSVFVGMAMKGSGLGLQNLSAGTWSPVVLPNMDSTQLSVGALMAEHDGSLWIGTDREGLVHVHGQETDHFGESEGMTGNVVTALMQDLQGSVWVTTTNGLDCFRKLRVVSYSAREGFPTDFVGVVAASKDGAVWVGDQGGLTLLRQGKISTIGREGGLPGLMVTAVLEQASGLVWVGVDGEVFTYSNGHFEKVIREGPGSDGSIVNIIEDAEHTVWVMRSGRPYQLLRFDSHALKLADTPTSPWELNSFAHDPEGGLLAASGMAGATTASTILRFRAGAWQQIASGPRKPIYGILNGADGASWGVTRVGILSWKDNQSHLLDTKHGLQCQEIFSLVSDNDGNLWAYASCGLMRISRDDVRRWRDNPDSIVTPRLFDVFDGVLAGITPFSPAAARSSDGRLWFANGNILQTINPSDLAPSKATLPVCIEELVADHGTVALSGSTTPALPALTRSLEFRYTALSPANARKLRFRYRLDGFDTDWQDAGTRRAAFYNDLGPGHYRFRVIALDEDGAWTPEGAALAFSVRPAWYQTGLFRISAVVAALLATWTLYAARIRQVRRQAVARYDERIQERTRLARDLHDTLLQTIQASKIVVDVALERPGGDGEQRLAIERVSGWLAQAVEEGRAALQSLRIPSDDSVDLSVALANAVAECNDGKTRKATFIVQGLAWTLSPSVQDEVYRIGSEALKNAFAHSDGHQISVVLCFASGLSLSISDDGVGIDPDILKAGRPGHFGIAGMMERATRIGAKLSITHAAGGGTSVYLTLSRRISSVDRRHWRHLLLVLKRRA